MRHLVLSGVAALALLTATLHPVAQAPSASAATPRPNVVIVFLDDMRQDDLVAMPQTQALIGAMGATFENAYAPYPLCCPARATILSGRYPHNNNVLSNYAPTGGVSAFNPRHTIGTWLKGRGYATAYIGKYLNGYGSATPKRYIPPGWTSWVALAQAGFNYRSYTLNVNGRLRSYSGAYQTDVLGYRSTAFIRRAGSRPFLLVTGFLAPHSGSPVEEDDAEGELGCFNTGLCGNVTPAVSDVYADTELSTMPTSPAYGEEDVSDKPSHIQALPEFPSDFAPAHQELYEQRLESLRSADDQVRNLVETLRETGQLSRTYILVTSDNGFLMGEHRIPFGKVHPYEPSARIPMLLRGPGIRPGTRVRQLVGLHDLAPTVLSASGSYGVQTRPLDGVSLLKLTADRRAYARRDLVLEAGPIGDVPDDWPVRRSSPGARPYRGIRTNTGWKYIRYDTGEVELYNLRTDPEELDNLADDPAYANRRRALARATRLLSTCSGRECTVDAAD